MKCQWHRTYFDEIVPVCEEDATFTTCQLIGGVVCKLHKCRCSKPLPPQLEIPGLEKRGPDGR